MEEDTKEIFQNLLKMAPDGLTAAGFDFNFPLSGWKKIFDIIVSLLTRSTP